MLFSLITLDLSRATKNFLLRTLLMRRGPRDMETNRKRNKRITETNRRKNQVCSFSRLNQFHSFIFLQDYEREITDVAEARQHMQVIF